MMFSRVCKRFVLLFFVLILFFNSCSDKKDDKSFYYPADFDPIESTCFIWTDEYFEIIPKLTGIISLKDKVTVYFNEQEASESKITETIKKYKGKIENVKLVKIKNRPKSNWIRDFGPVYLVNKNGESKLIDFGYFGKRLEFNTEIASKTNISLIQSTFNSSGGSRETNGDGTLILCETHELDVNKPKTKIDIEAEYKEKLSVENIIWMKRGLPQDDSRLNGPIYENIYPNGVNGHVDQFCRFADKNTVLIATVTEEEAKLHPILAEAKKRMEENCRILENSTDCNGRKFKILKVPFAPLLFIERNLGSNRIFVTPVTSYLNFIVTNNLVIIPSYTSTQPDDNLLQNKEIEVEEIFRKAFPTRSIVKVHAADLNSFSGGFHCISINNPLALN